MTYLRNQMQEELHDALAEEAKDKVEPVTIDKVAVETSYIAVGLKHADKRILRIKINDKPWRSPKSTDFNKFIFWMMELGLEPTNRDVPKARSGSQKAKYFFGQSRIVIPIQDQNPCSGSELR